MPTNHAASLVHLLGFIAGAALYAMLLAMVVRSRAAAPRAARSTDRLPLVTALLGLAWNVGGLAAYASRDLLGGEPIPLVVAASYTALGFLPAVVVHAALASASETAAWARPAVALTIAYGLGAVAGVMHLADAIVAGHAPSNTALALLSVGFVLVTVAIFASTRGQTGWGRAVWVAALAVFAVTALHVGSDAGHDSWWVELLGHHASLPLAIAILYQDYRFALADIFLKRALLLLALASVSCLAYLGIDPLLAMRTATGETDPRAVSGVVAILVATALVYPVLRGVVWWFVDAVVLRRGDYAALRADVALLSTMEETVEGVLGLACERLAKALDASAVTWREVSALASTSDPSLFATEVGGHAGALRVPTAESPEYEIRIGTLEGGRRILSDDVAALEAVAHSVARRIDALRVNHERCERNVREQEMGKLATEAELRALRAQLNPHFLFNALTTIGYLIQTSPERALDTLMRLTGLLRAVLRQQAGDSVTLGEELDLVEAYLAIERARFEERLRVTIDVPPELRDLHVPLLVVQPLVENAVKHGISPLRDGGEVSITARLDGLYPDLLVLRVIDSGAGVSEPELVRHRRHGVGLANVERRLEMTYGGLATLEISSERGHGTAVEVRLPAERSAAARSRA